MLRQQMNLPAVPQTRNRRVLAERMDTVSIPYLIDPNTGQEMGESGDILEYLRSTYTA